MVSGNAFKSPTRGLLNFQSASVPPRSNGATCISQIGVCFIRIAYFQHINLSKITINGLRARKDHLRR